MRLKDIKGGDKELIDHISRAIQELPRPHVSIGQLRNISYRALKLIWDIELKNRDIPPEWTRAWQHDGVKDAPKGRLAEDGRQLQVLSLLTDGRNTVRPKVVTRSMYCLVNFLFSVGNLGQHQTTPPTIGFAGSVCFAAVQLADELSQALRPKTAGS